MTLIGQNRCLARRWLPLLLALGVGQAGLSESGRLPAVYFRVIRGSDLRIDQDTWLNLISQNKPLRLDLKIAEIRKACEDSIDEKLLADSAMATVIPIHVPLDVELFVTEETRPADPHAIRIEARRPLPHRPGGITPGYGWIVVIFRPIEGATANGKWTLKFSFSNAFDEWTRKRCETLYELP